MTKTDDGIRVVDVWESRQAFDQFMTLRSGVVAPEVGAAEPPEIQFFEVHNYLRRRPVERLTGAVENPSNRSNRAPERGCV